MNEKNHLESIVMQAKDDLQIRNQLITDYKPLIIKTLSESQGEILSNHFEDFISVGMSAFEEAIRDYDSDKGSFVTFVKRIIRLRSIDYYRKVKKIEAREVLVGDDGEKTRRHQDNSSLTAYENNKIAEDRKDDIERFKNLLGEWGITLSDLVHHSPKSNTLKRTYQDVAKILVESGWVFENFLEVKRLPVKYLLKRADINRRKIERGRIYIISIALIMNGDFKTIREYIL